jgi:hypothetical protein
MENILQSQSHIEQCQEVQNIDIFTAQQIQNARSTLNQNIVRDKALMTTKIMMTTFNDILKKNIITKKAFVETSGLLNSSKTWSFVEMCFQLIDMELSLTWGTTKYFTENKYAFHISWMFRSIGNHFKMQLHEHNYSPINMLII